MEALCGADSKKAALLGHGRPGNQDVLVVKAEPSKGGSNDEDRGPTLVFSQFMTLEKF